MSVEKFQPGQAYEQEFEVTKEYTTNRMGKEGADVLSTPALLGLMENTCIKQSEPHMAQGYTTVGYAVDGMRHFAAAPLGQKVTIKVQLTDVDREKNRLTYAIDALEGEKKVAIAKHGRAVIPIR
jgi:fluoroacetyl-CoA thioesterase